MQWIVTLSFLDDMVDALHDFGIKEFTKMAINEFYGHALKPWPSGFDGNPSLAKKILAYNGPIYGANKFPLF